MKFANLTQFLVHSCMAGRMKSNISLSLAPSSINLAIEREREREI